MIKLPDEILIIIFSNFDVDQLMRIETVCKRWKNLSRSNKSFWKSLPPLYENPTVKEFNNLIELVRKRGNGTIPSLYAPINILHGEFEEIKRFCKILPELKVETLFIHFTPDVEEIDDDYSNDERYDKFQELRNLMRGGEFLDASNEILNSIAQCSNLEMLSISTHFDDCPASFPLDLASKPISNCHLKVLILCGIDVNSFFSQSIAYDILSKVEIVRISGNHELTESGILEQFNGSLHNLSHFTVIRSREQEVYRNFILEVETSKKSFDKAVVQSDHGVGIWHGSLTDEGDRLISILQDTLKIGREKILFDEDLKVVVARVLLSKT